MSVIAAVDDLFFAARIRETARQTGVAADVVPVARLEAAMLKLVDEGGVEGAILDLGAASAVEALRALKSNARTRAVPVVGFVSHVATEAIAAAREAGCDQVFARSAFTRRLPEILQDLARPAVGESEPQFRARERA